MIMDWIEFGTVMVFGVLSCLLMFIILAWVWHLCIKAGQTAEEDKRGAIIFWSICVVLLLLMMLAFYLWGKSQCIIYAV